MKLVIKKGRTLESVLTSLEELFEEFEDYPILQTDMTVYFYLEDEAHCPCPDNDTLYTLEFDEESDDPEKDFSPEEKVEIARLKAFTAEGWRNYVSYQRWKFAKDKAQMKPSELRKAEKRQALLNRLEHRFNTGMFTWGYVPENNPMHLEFHIYWKDEDGENWYFIAYNGLHNKPYGRLNYGLTPGY